MANYRDNLLCEFCDGQYKLDSREVFVEIMEEYDYLNKIADSSIARRTYYRVPGLQEYQSDLDDDWAELFLGTIALAVGDCQGIIDDAIKHRDTQNQDALHTFWGAIYDKIQEHKCDAK